MNFFCVTPCLNPGPLLQATILSLLRQGYLEAGRGKLTYVIRDGGSADGTIDLAQRILRQHGLGDHLEYSVVSEPDTGMYDALAKGFRQCQGSDVYFYLNAGDLLSPSAFDVVASLMGRQDVRFLTGINAWFNEPGHLTHFDAPRFYSRRLLRKGFYVKTLPAVQQESTFWHHDVHRLLDFEMLKTFRYAGDSFMWQTFARHVPLCFVHAWLGGFRHHSGQLSERFQEEYLRELARFSERHTPLDAAYALALKHAPVLKRFLGREHRFYYSPTLGRYTHLNGFFTKTESNA